MDIDDSDFNELVKRHKEEIVLTFVDKGYESELNVRVFALINEAAYWRAKNEMEKSNQ